MLSALAGVRQSQEDNTAADFPANQRAVQLPKISEKKIT